MSSDSVHRVTEYQTAGTNARLRLFALLQAQGVPAAEADDLVAALEASAVAGAQSEVVELDGMAPASQGARFADGWDEGVAVVSEALVGIADRDWVRRGGRPAELAVHISDVRRRERAAPAGGVRPGDRAAVYAPEHYGAAAGAGGAGRGRRSVHGADGGGVQW
ncbi:hypothetical protein ABZ723_33440 [Streptomyces sp. NPDC006700]|uniref:hypothetical protein n=1 Tax=Streptomyces sp. NPDC006700 TaxID=3154479 RepID=UPI0034118733